ncbi:hypothetical protein LTR78_007771 [Recurvomyces mirabilis]|uniref:Uncharacterized protein n=1 Tax=Recurvomyces mirabilis TaxID=574656 RepID=A0AAE0TSD3_9PEZI|nr:hypothetical protein LTR78_007771 [Recurvomyces mirabilis]KAK5151659.1 hypothetical protein LTS14_009146 [Recurvomyces mirabilis]
MAGKDKKKQSLRTTVEDVPDRAEERKASTAIDSPIELRKNASPPRPPPLRVRPPPLDIPITKPPSLIPGLPSATNKSPVRYFLNTPSLPPPKQPKFIDKYVMLHFNRIALVDILDRDAKTRSAFWVNRVLIRNPEAYLNPADVWAVYGASFIFHKKLGLLQKDEFIELVYKLFAAKGIQRKELTDALPYDTPPEKVVDILATQQLAVKVRFENPDAGQPPLVYDFDDHIRKPFTVDDRTVKDCVGLWLYPEPMRTQLWLEMLFEEGANEEVEESTLWAMYGVTFNKSPMRHVDQDVFIDLIQESFPKSDRANVAPDTWVIYGIRPREKVLSLKAIERIVMRSSRRHSKEHTLTRLQRFHDRGDLVLRNTPTSALNTFQEHLLKKPLLSLTAGKVSPWMQRLETRNAGKAVGGDQPGCPGYSLRELDRIIGMRNHRRKIAAAKKEAERLVGQGEVKGDGAGL